LSKESHRFGIAGALLSRGAEDVLRTVERHAGQQGFQEFSEVLDVAVSAVVKEESKDSLLGDAVEKK
jgi:hypothetical protein